MVIIFCNSGSYGRSLSIQKAFICILYSVAVKRYLLQGGSPLTISVLLFDKEEVRIIVSTIFILNDTDCIGDSCIRLRADEQYIIAYCSSYIRIYSAFDIARIRTTTSCP